MEFEVDNQTLKDLEIFGNSKNEKSIFDLFNFTNYLGGRKKMYALLSNPTSDYAELTERKEALQYMQRHFSRSLVIDKDALYFVEYYFKHIKYMRRLPSRGTSLSKLLSIFDTSDEFYIIEKGVESIVTLLKNVDSIANSLKKLSESHDYPVLLKRYRKKVNEIFSRKEYKEILKSNKINPREISDLDNLFRHTDKKTILFILDLVYEYDALLSVVKAADKYKLTYPEILHSEENCLEIEGLFHPFVENAVANDLNFEKDMNLLFVSGPNMAGKSTLLKSLGIAIYLAHIGFPVPASRMKFSILSGLCTTINISDNLSSGYSHFYAEVMRIKSVADRLRKNNNMLVIFDELFRGTNVKDAYDGTLAIVSAFSKIKSSFFIISTHIVEVAKELENNKNIEFAYLNVEEQNGHPFYTYKLKKGVSDVRLGMYIINKERLIEHINEAINQNIE